MSENPVGLSRFSCCRKEPGAGIPITDSVFIACGVTVGEAAAILNRLSSA